MSHPSSYALDLLALGHADRPTREHLASCATCRAQVDASKPIDGPVPGWVPRTGRRAFTWTRPLFAMAVLSAAVVLVVTARHSERQTETTTAKGFPSFAVWVDRGGRVQLWDGRAPFVPGDRLQLRVAAAGFRHLVVGLEEGGTWSTLFDGPVSPKGESDLPVSFRVDERTGPMRLGLLLCARRCEHPDLSSSAAQAPRDAERWWTDFELRRGGSR